ncbi:MAG: efflux RND transporter periplasmic adaptor subunit [[Bacteroides] pectinophilus]|nr:efflux RND transporter periplasmic adaptor subunit [[Bacteroides] pectinophilus]
MKHRLQKLAASLRKHLKVIIPIFLVIVIAAIAVFRTKKTTDTYTEETVQVRNVATYLTFSGNVEAVSDATIKPKVSKTVTAVNVSIGDEVKKGDVIATLDDSEIQRSIKKQEAALSNTELNNFYSIRDSQKKYDNYKADLENGQNSQIMSAANSVENARTSYEQAKETYERNKMELENNMDSSVISSNQKVASAKQALDDAKQDYDDNEAKIRGYDKGVSNAESIYGEDSAEAASAQKELDSAEEKSDSLQKAIDNAQTNYDNAINDLLMSYYTSNVSLNSDYENMQQKYTAYQQAQASYEVAVKSANETLQDYADSLEKTQATSNTTTATVELEALYDQLEDYKITAPIDGVITVLNINVGDSASTSDTAAEVTNYDKMKVQIKIDEDNISALDNGTEVTVSVDALNKTYKGTVENMSKKATVSNNVSYFTADVTFDADDDIRSGLSAEVKYLLNGVENVVAVSMSALNYNTDNTAYVLVGDNASTAQQRNVTLGISNGTYVEVKEGLSEGETVLVKQSKTSEALMSMGMGGGQQPQGQAPDGNGGGPGGDGGGRGGNGGNGGGAPGGGPGGN